MTFNRSSTCKRPTIHHTRLGYWKVTQAGLTRGTCGEEITKVYLLVESGYTDPGLYVWDSVFGWLHLGGMSLIENYNRGYFIPLL